MNIVKLCTDCESGLEMF